MESSVLRESLTMFFIGGWLWLQCYDIIVREDVRAHLLCVSGKILLTAGFLLLYPAPFFALLYFFAFYPKTERSGISLRLFGVQVLLTAGAALFCVFGESVWNQLVTAAGVFLPALFLAAAEFGIRSLVLKNRVLYRQMEKTALSELKVKNLNREIGVRSQTAEQNARLEEREHIARNIHNVVGHTITAALVSLQAYGVLKETQPVRAEGKLTAASERMHLALEEIRRAVRVLDAETEEIDMRDFCSLLATEMEKFSSDTELRMVHNFSEFCGTNRKVMLEKRTCEFLHSVLTECLNNGIRHGAATAFLVFLAYDAAHIRLTVSDDGRGFDGLAPAEQKRRLEQGYGLRKMKDYAEHHGGTFQFRAENGFWVRVEIPLAEGGGKNGGNDGSSGISD